MCDYKLYDGFFFLFVYSLLFYSRYIDVRLFRLVFFVVVSSIPSKATKSILVSGSLTKPFVKYKKKNITKTILPRLTHSSH